MLLELVFNLIMGTITLVLESIPTIAVSSDFELGLEAVSDLTATFAYFLPMKTFGACLLIILSLDNTRFIISIFNFIIRKIPGIN